MNHTEFSFPRAPILQLRPPIATRSVGNKRTWKAPAFPGGTYAIALAAKPFLARLQRELKRPVAIDVTGHSRHVIVFDLFVYDIDRKAQRIRAGLRKTTGEIRWLTEAIEVFRPLRTQFVAEYLAEQWQLAPDNTRDRQALIKTLWRFMWSMPRFQELRCKLLPAALAIPQPLMWLALQARTPGAPANSIVTNRMLNTVWMHQTAFARLARENHQLMPLFLEAIEYGLDIRPGDAAQQLKQLFRNFGLNDRAWRFVTRYGIRRFRPLFTEWGLGKTWEAIIAYLQFVADATESPPPSRFVHLWMELTGERLVFDEDSCSPAMPSWVRALAISASRDPTLNFREYEHQLFAVAEHYLDGDGTWKKTGNVSWNALARRALDWQQRKSALADANPNFWESLIGDCRIRGYQVTPLICEADLISAGFRLHNCLARNVSRYANIPTIRLFQMSNIENSGNRAVVSLRFDGKLGEWRVAQVSGFANRPVPQQQKAVARELAKDRKSVV